MKWFAARRSILRTARIALVFLAAAVFAWGLQSKLALYKAPSPSRNASVAKLLHAKQKQPSFRQTSPARVRTALASFGWTTRPVLSKVVLRIMREQRRSKAFQRSVHLSVAPSFFRPPPQIQSVYSLI